MVYNLKLSRAEAYLKVALFVGANLALPQLFHIVPGGGVMFLPIYFFTAVAAMRYGWQVGLLTAVLTPVLGSLLFGAPAAHMVPDMLFKGALLSIAAALIVRKMGVSLLASFIAVAGAWLIAGLVEWPLMGAGFAFQDFVTGIPGMLMIIVGSWLINKYIK